MTKQKYSDAEREEILRRMVSDGGEWSVIAFLLLNLRERIAKLEADLIHGNPKASGPQ